MATGFDDLPVTVRFNSSGNIDAVNGGTLGQPPTYSAVNVVPYSANGLYDFIFTINETSHTYSLTVSTGGGTPVTIASNYAFRVQQATAVNLDNVGMFVETPTGTITTSNMSFGFDSVAPTRTR